MTLSHTILCVDDDVDDLHLLKKAIASIDTKYEIIEAYNGVEALEKLSEMRAADKLPSLIVMDINMPKMDGRETFLSIKNDEKLAEIPLVILSTSSSVLDRIFFHKKNIEYITKPIHFDTLVTIARKLLSYCKTP
jgi:two-component system response regulator